MPPGLADHRVVVGHGGYSAAAEYADRIAGEHCVAEGAVSAAGVAASGGSTADHLGCRAGLVTASTRRYVGASVGGQTRIAGIAALPYREGVQLLLGGLITLAVTAVVQIFVIPWVQHRNRRRERWENDILELHSLLKDEMPHADYALMIAACDYWSALFDIDPRGKSASNDERQHSLGEAMTAWESQQSLLWRAMILTRKVQLVHTHAPAWHSFKEKINGLANGMALLDPTAGRSALYRKDPYAPIDYGAHPLMIEIPSTTARVRYVDAGR